MFLVHKYTEYKAAQAEQQRKKVTEKELSHLNHKIDKLLSKLEEHEPEQPTNQDEECVVCVNAKATMTTFPCAHRVVCRKCFVKTIQMAVAQRLLPLRCVICRAKVLRLKQGPPSNVPQSASLYSVSSNASNTSGVSWTSASSAASARTDPFPTLRRAQMARMGYQPLRSLSPPPLSAKPPSTKSTKRKNVLEEVQPRENLAKGKAKLTQDFQREFRLGIRTANLTGGGTTRIRCCRQLVAEAEAEGWKKSERERSPPSAQGQRG